MLFIGGILAVVLIIITAIFAFPSLSPIPYFPSNRKDLEKILDSLHLKNGQTIVDLGAGDGLIIFEAAQEAHDKKLDTQFVADEINPVLYLIMSIRRLFHPNRKNIRVVLKDMFKMHDSPLPKDQLTFYLYVSPWFLERIYRYLKKNYSHFSILSYMYAIPDLKPKKVIQGHHKIFVY